MAHLLRTDKKLLFEELIRHFPEASIYLHKLNIEQTDQGLMISEGQVPEPHASEILKWFNNLPE